MTAPPKSLESPDGLAGQSLGAAPCSVTWPDIGKDPLKYRDEVLGGVEGADQRLSLASAVQQKGVPDQTALVWRIDIDRLICELIVMTARWNSRQRIKAPPNAPHELPPTKTP